MVIIYIENSGIDEIVLPIVISIFVLVLLFELKNILVIRHTYRKIVDLVNAGNTDIEYILNKTTRTKAFKKIDNNPYKNARSCRRIIMDGPGHERFENGPNYVFNKELVKFLIWEKTEHGAARYTPTNPKKPYKDAFPNKNI